MLNKKVYCLGCGTFADLFLSTIGTIEQRLINDVIPERLQELTIVYVESKEG